MDGVQEQVWTTDWIMSRPVFYNSRTRAVGHTFNDVVDWQDVAIDANGFNNYLEFGFSAFGRTPIRDVCFLYPCQRLTRSNDGLEIADLEDPAESLVGRTDITDERDVLHDLKDRVGAWERGTAGPIVMPVSGGFDSRLLSLMIEDRSRIRAFTFGTSADQMRSVECVKAARLAEILGACWQRVPVHESLRHMPAWFARFGCSIHAHGMHQMEFYTCVRQAVPDAEHLLSGIIGDAWSGHHAFAPVSTVSDIAQLALAHGLHADRVRSRLTGVDDDRLAFMERYERLLSDPRGRVIMAMRLKMLLLGYLYRVPEMHAFTPWSPFLDFEAASSMLRLPSVRRRDRQWQRDYFAREGVDLEHEQLDFTWEIDEGHVSLDEHPVTPLDTDLLEPYVKPDYVVWINRVVCRPKWRRHACRSLLLLRNRTIDWPVISGPLYKMGVRGIPSTFSAAWAAYRVLWPIQETLKRAA